MDKLELKDLLDSLYYKYNSPGFIESDPISIPHRYELRDDIEISGFFASIISWGNRKAIVKSCCRMMDCMDNDPYDFTINASDKELAALSSFVHRTFNGTDFRTFVLAIRGIYTRFGGIGNFFEQKWLEHQDMRIVLSEFRSTFFEIEHEKRSEKHLSSIDKKSACKRLNMYIRWMVRRDNNGVDFGLWDKIPMSALYIPLDVHTGNIGRELRLLTRHHNDWRSVEELTGSLRLFDPEDPVKYDYSLFGAGINNEFKM